MRSESPPSSPRSALVTRRASLSASASSREPERELGGLRRDPVGKALEVGGAPPPCENPERDHERQATRGRKQIRVVEVRVDDLRQRRRVERRPKRHAERVRRGHLQKAKTTREDEPRGCGQLEALSAVRQIRRPEGARGAVRVIKLGERLGDRLVEVPAAAAEELGREAVVAQPRRLAAHPLGVLPARHARARRLRRDEVGVMPERPEGSRLARPLEPPPLVLPRAGVRRSHQRRDAEPSRSFVLQRRKPLPAGVVERTLDVTGDDGAELHAPNQTRSRTWAALGHRETAPRRGYSDAPCAGSAGCSLPPARLTPSSSRA